MGCVMESDGDDEPWSLRNSAPMCLLSAANLGLHHRVKQLIIEEGNDVNMRNQSGWTSLMYAAFCGRVSVVELLVSREANCDLQNDEGRNALMLAAIVGHVAVVQILIKKPCAVELRDRRNWTALFYATQNRHDDVVKLLLLNKANVNSIEKRFGYTALMIAAIEGHLSTAMLLLNHGADLYMKSFAGDTAQSLALIHGHTNMARQIIDQRSFSASQSVQPHNLRTLLSLNGLAQYFQLFEEQEIDFDLFLTLSESDLIDIGIKNLGPRKKIINIIHHILNNTQVTREMKETNASALPKTVQLRG